MTLDEVIEKLKYDFEIDMYIRDITPQLVWWLEELNSYRAHIFSGDMTQKMLKEEYYKAIDDFVKEFKRKTPMENMIIDEIAERLKGDASSGTDDQ